MRVLVVDDEPDLRALYAVNLRDAGHEVLTASNGAEGLGVVERESPDVVLVDLMPVMDGYEFLQNLRRMPGHQGTPAIVVSARWRREASAESLARSGFVAKPFDADELVSVVEGCTA